LPPNAAILWLKRNIGEDDDNIRKSERSTRKAREEGTPFREGEGKENDEDVFRHF
jgi:hypothetical protein